MKRHQMALAATGLSAALLLSACGGSDDKKDDGDKAAPGASGAAGAPKDGTIKLVVADYGSGDGSMQKYWNGVISSFNEKNPGIKVNLQVINWDDIDKQVATMIQNNDMPDLLQTGGYADKVVDDLLYPVDEVMSPATKADFVESFTPAATVKGKQYGIPFTSSTRQLIYNTDLFTKAGLKPPTTYDEVVSAAKTLKEKNTGSKFSAFYAPGKYVYAGLAWVKGSAGEIAKKDGDKWVGQLNLPASQEGLTKWADLVKNYSVGDKTKDEQDQDPIFAQGQTGMMYGSSWELGAVQEQPKDPNNPESPKVKTKVNGKVAATAMPGIPSFLGGSDLGVTAKAANPELAAQWIKTFTDTQSQEALIAKGALPNATNLLDKAAAVEGNKASAEAAKNSWFVPMAPKWAEVESANVIQEMLTSIATGKATVADATKKADDQINTILNS
jgi:N,N'-diacetylchitobiose transport system substrate-binding protein